MPDPPLYSDTAARLFGSPLPDAPPGPTAAGDPRVRRVAADLFGDLFAELFRGIHHELAEIRHQLHRMETAMTAAVNQQQVDLDAIAQGLTDIDTQLGNLVNTINADDSAIATEIAALAQQAAQAGVTLDLSGVQAAQAKLAADVQTNLGAAVQATTSLLPPQSAPSAPSTPSPDQAATPPAQPVNVAPPADDSGAGDSGSSAEAGSSDGSGSDPAAEARHSRRTHRN